MKTCPLILLTAAAAWSPLTLAAEAAPAAAAQTAPAASGPQADYPKALALAGPKSTDADKAEALRLLRASADSGYAPAITELGHATLHGRGTPANPAEALRLFEAAAAKGDTQGLAFAGHLHYFRAIPGASVAKGVALLRSACEKGDPHICYNFDEIADEHPRHFPLDESVTKWSGNCEKPYYAIPKPVRIKRINDYLALLDKRIAEGDGLAAYRRAKHLREGSWGAKDTKRAEALMRKAVEFGYTDAAFKLAEWAYYDGKKSTPEKAAAFIRAAEQAADASSHNAANYLGYQFSRKVSGMTLLPVGQDYAKAAKYWTIAADAGVADASAALGEIRYLGLDGVTDKPEAFLRLREAARHTGNFDGYAHATLGMLALMGEDVGLSDAELRALLEKNRPNTTNFPGKVYAEFLVAGRASGTDWDKALPYLENHYATQIEECAQLVRLLEVRGAGPSTLRDFAKFDEILENQLNRVNPINPRPESPGMERLKWDFTRKIVRDTIARLKSRADAGDGDSAVTLAMLLQTGWLDGTRNTDEAIRILTPLTERNHARANRYLADLLEIKNGIQPREKSTKASLYRRAAELGDPKACLYLAEYPYLLDWNERTHAKEITALVEKAAKAGLREAFEPYASRLHEGIGCTANHALAAEWFLKSQSQPTPRSGSDAIFYLTLMRLTGDGMPQDRPAALKAIKVSAPNGFQWAAVLYIDALLRGDGMPADRPAAMKLLEQYANGSHKTAWGRILLAEQHLVGDKRDALAAARLADSAFASDIHDLDRLQIARGQGGWTRPSYAREQVLLRDAVAASVKRLRALADNGDSTAAGIVARLLKEGVGVPADADAAKAYAAKAAEAGDPAALFTAANDLLGAEKRDVAKAAPLLKRAADAGFAPAAQRYALLLLLGDGVPENPAEGVKYLRLATDAGERDARCRLGECLAAGIGAPKDEAEAVRLWKLNLNPAHPLSVRLLADACEHGRGIPADPAEAAGLLQYLSRNDRSVGNRAEALMDKLTPEQRRAAEKRFRELLFNRPGL